MNKQTPGQLFLNMFLKSVVVLMGVGICVFGVFFLTQVVKKAFDTKDGDGPATTVDANVLTEVDPHDHLLMNTEAPTTEAPTTEAPQYSSSTSCKILVLNSTEQAGLAGSWCEKLNGYGYSDTEASDYSNTLTTTKIVAKKDGVGKDLLQYFSGAEYEVGEVGEGAYYDTSAYDIIIILGTDQQTE